MYIKASGDKAIAAEDKTCSSIKRILDHYLIGHFELIPTLLVPDGAFMIDRRMGMHGHPLDIEIFFDAAMRSGREILNINASEDDKKYFERIDTRIVHLRDHIRTDYWIELSCLKSISQYETEQFGDEVVNKYNIQPPSIPGWTNRWIPVNGGYFLGNIGPGRIDSGKFSISAIPLTRCAASLSEVNHLSNGKGFCSLLSQLKSTNFVRSESLNVRVR
jgi:hypothetical protein